MWADDYIGSLDLLPGTLAELGATAGLDRVSLKEEEDEEGKLDLTRAVYFATIIFEILDTLEEDDYFFLLNTLSEIERELKSLLVLPRQWTKSEIADPLVDALMPVLRALCRFAPQKTLGILLNMKDFLEDIGGFGWDGEDCLEILTVLQEDLEELQPGSCLACLEELHRLLVFHSRHLPWLASLPFFQRKLGWQNLVHKLISLSPYLKVVLSDRDLLVKMQEVSEELSQLKVIDLQE